MTEKKQFSNNSCLLVSIRGSIFVTFVVKFGFCEKHDIVKVYLTISFVTVTMTERG